MYEKVRKFYMLGLYNAEQVYMFAKNGVITYEQYNDIVSGK